MEVGVDQLSRYLANSAVARISREHDAQAICLRTLRRRTGPGDEIQAGEHVHPATLPRGRLSDRPCGLQGQSTGPEDHTPAMRRTPFDDPRAFRRRWAHLTPEQLIVEASRDPLLFAADHTSIFDRHEGTVVVLAELHGDPQPTVIVIPGGPPDPSEEDCLGLLAGVVARIDEAAGEWTTVQDGDVCIVRRIGLVTHRLGASMVNDIDRRWMRALGLVSVALGIEVIGVAARTRSGAIVRIPESAVAA